MFDFICGAEVRERGREKNIFYHYTFISKFTRNFVFVVRPFPDTPIFFIYTLI